MHLQRIASALQREDFVQLQSGIPDIGVLVPWYLFHRNKQCELISTLYFSTTEYAIVIWPQTQNGRTSFY
jgi:hypothetical protein